MEGQSTGTASRKAVEYPPLEAPQTHLDVFLSHPVTQSGLGGWSG